MGGIGLSAPGLDPGTHRRLEPAGEIPKLNRKLFFGIGFAIWLLATIVIRAFGHIIFLYEEAAYLRLLWPLTFAAMLALANALFRWQKLSRSQRFEAAALLVISGMLLDAFVTQFFAWVFPNMPAEAAGSFAAWLLIAYAGVLMAPFMPGAED